MAETKTGEVFARVTAVIVMVAGGRVAPVPAYVLDLPNWKLSKPRLEAMDLGTKALSSQAAAVDSSTAILRILVQHSDEVFAHHANHARYSDTLKASTFNLENNRIVARRS